MGISPEKRVLQIAAPHVFVKVLKLLARYPEMDGRALRDVEKYPNMLETATLKNHGEHFQLIELSHLGNIII